MLRGSKSVRCNWLLASSAAFDGKVALLGAIRPATNMLAKFCNQRLRFIPLMNPPDGIRWRSALPCLRSGDNER